ncbi:MAG: universal stress protein [Candidatus Neomarinimicrobiota bacterium]
MKFLVGIGSKEYSEPTLNIGSRIAKSFGADLSVVYVGPKPKQIHEGRINLVRDALANWEIYHPGIEILKWAFDYLHDSSFLEEKEEIDVFHPENMVEEKGRFRMVLPARYGQTISLILREGDIIGELRRECNQDDYTLTIIGGSKKRRMAHNLIQYIPTSVLVSENVDLSREYKVLLCVDDSEATKRAVRFGATIAQNLEMAVELLTVSKTTHFGSGYRGAARSAARYLDSKNITYNQQFLTGDPVRTFVKVAGDDHIIVMGLSTQSPLKKFFVGSKPIKTLELGNCPILVVR